jgi:hypothetical protein
MTIGDWIVVYTACGLATVAVSICGGWLSDESWTSRICGYLGLLQLWPIIFLIESLKALHFRFEQRRRK